MQQIAKQHSRWEARGTPQVLREDFSSDRQPQNALLQQQGQQVIPAEGGNIGQQGVGRAPQG